MENTHTYRKLLVWQKSMTFVTKIYNETKSFPSEELYALTSQIKRSAISIPSNISEGFGRKGQKDYLRFLNIALSSLFELQTQIEIAFNLNFLSEHMPLKNYMKTLGKLNACSLALLTK